MVNKRTVQEIERTIRVTERIYELQDFEYKKGPIKRYVDNFYWFENKFFSQLNNLIITENQKGKIVEAMQQESLTFMGDNIRFLRHLESRSEEVVFELQSQVNKMNLQEMTVTYVETRT